MCACVTLTVHLIGCYQFGTFGYDGNIMVFYQHLYASFHQLGGGRREEGGGKREERVKSYCMILH